MSFFTSSREKRLWAYVLIVLIAIIATLIFGSPLRQIQLHQDTVTIIFWISFIAIGTTVLIHGLRTLPDKTEVTVWIGITAVYLLLFLRLGHPERSHMMEYSVLAIFIYRALIERTKSLNKVFVVGITAFLLTFLLGILDEVVQMFLPNRVFDLIDILFNSLATFMAIGSSMILQWSKKKFRKNK